MTFYEACPLIKADEEIRQSHLKLVKLTAETLKPAWDYWELRLWKNIITAKE